MDQTSPTSSTKSLRKRNPTSNQPRSSSSPSRLTSTTGRHEVTSTLSKRRFPNLKSGSSIEDEARKISRVLEKLSKWDKDTKLSAEKLERDNEKYAEYVQNIFDQNKKHQHTQQSEERHSFLRSILIQGGNFKDRLKFDRCIKKAEWLAFARKMAECKTRNIAELIKVLEAHQNMKAQEGGPVTVNPTSLHQKCRVIVHLFKAKLDLEVRQEFMRTRERYAKIQKIAVSKWDGMEKKKEKLEEEIKVIQGRYENMGNALDSITADLDKVKTKFNEEYGRKILNYIDAMNGVGDPLRIRSSIWEHEQQIDGYLIPVTSKFLSITSKFYY